MDRFKNIKKRIWAILFGSLGSVLVAGIFIGGVLSDIEAAKKHVEEHPQRLAEYNAVIQEFRTANAVINGEIKAAAAHRERQDKYLQAIVGHLSRLGVVTEPIVYNRHARPSGGNKIN